jgi:serine phosphatase RsbU (regulator of sigma subunit)
MASAPHDRARTPDPSFDRYARMVSRALGTPVALVSLVEADRQVFPGARGLPPEVDRVRETPLSHSFCQHVVADGAPLVITDARQDERLRDNLAIPELGVVAYAGWPITDHTGAIVGSLCAIDTEPRAWTAGDLEMLEDLAAACSTELSERATRAAEIDLSHRSNVLLALSDGLAPTRTLADVAAAVDRIAVELLGCLAVGIWVRTSVDGDGGAVREHLAYVDHPASTWDSARVNRRLALDDSNPLGGTIVAGRGQHFPDRAGQNARYPRVDISRQVGEARSFVPLIGRDDVIGALALIWPGRRVLSDEDQVTVEALASYAGQALQRALLLQDRLDALVTLQKALMPHLPQPNTLELAARYFPAATQDQVGGDWYDAVVMPSGATSLMVGDVVGHDIEAAAVMGQLRNMLRAIAWAVDDTPSHNVARLDQAMRDLDVRGMATLVYARIEQDADQRATGQRTLRWANAGHPPPLVVSAEGEARLLGSAGADLMLGVSPTTERTDHRAAIEAGSTLLLYTDGLVERRGEDLNVGLDRLAAAAAAHHGLRLEDFLDAVVADVLRDRLEDDVAVLAVRFHEQPGEPAS